MINLKGNDSIAAVAKVEKSEDEDEVIINEIENPDAPMGDIETDNGKDVDISNDEE